MVAPSALAETVTPESFSPAADVIDPLNSASAACADSGMSAVAANPAAAMVTNVKLFGGPRVFAGLMSFSLRVSICSARRRCGRIRCWHGFQVRDDGIDLGGLELKPKARHARGSGADGPPHEVLLAAERVLRQDRPILSARDLRLGVADDAGLIEQPLAELLRVVERRTGLGGLRPRALRHGKREERKHEDRDPDATNHLKSSRMHKLLRQ